MQTTLLGLAIGIILALATALIAPLVIDWNGYRPAFEMEATRLLGLRVRVNGPIEARILPSPHLKLRDVTVGEGDPQVRVETIELDVGLGPLLRGRIEVSELRLVGPQVKLGFDSSGVITWPVRAPSLRADALAISRFSILDGRVFVSDVHSKAHIVLQKLSFNGDLRSLIGPLQGDGAFVSDGELYAYRIASDRLEEDGSLKLKLEIDPTSHPLAIEAEGKLGFNRGIPQFAGTLALARPVAAALADGERVMSDPWQLAGKLSVTPASALLQDLVFQYGPEERAVNVQGKAELTFGQEPHLEGTLSAVQVDIDRAVAAPDVTHRPPFLIIKSFFEALVAAVRPPIPVRVGVAADAVTVGGTTIRSLHGNVRFTERQWSFNDFSFRAPGFTEVNLSGHLQHGQHGLTFSGPAKLESFNANALVRWLDGKARPDQTSASGPPLKAHADITITSDSVALERLSAVLGGENLVGRIAYTWATAQRSAAMDGELSATVLDLDALTAFARAAVSDHAIAVPHRLALVLDVGRLTFAGIEARKIDAKIKFDTGTLHIDRFSVGEVGGAALDIKGRIDEPSYQPHGRLTFDLDAGGLAGLLDAVSKFAPTMADGIRPFAGHLVPAKAQGTLTLEKGARTGTIVRLAISGQAGAMRLTLQGEASGEPQHASAAAVRVSSRIEADDGGALAQLFGLDRLITVDQLPGQITISASGLVNDAVHVSGLASAGGFSAAVEGALRWQGEQIPTGKFNLKASAADLTPLHRAMTGQSGGGIPISASATLATSGSDLTFTDVEITAGKSRVLGKLALQPGSPPRIGGNIEINDADASALAALLLGWPSAAHHAAAIWSDEPFGPGAFAALNGSLKFRIDRAVLLPTLAVRGFTGVVQFAPSTIALNDVEGVVAGGHLAGELRVRRDAQEFTARGRVALAGANAALLLSSDKPFVEGRLTLKVEGEAMGQTPENAVGSLHGKGVIALRDAHLSGIDPAAFEAATRAADQRGAIEAPRIEAAVTAAMAKGRFAAPKGDAELTIAAGRIQTTNLTLRAPDGAELSLRGAIDLGKEVVDAQLTLSGQARPDALIPSRPELAITLRGRLAAPERKLDVSPLVAWLTLRAAELQTRRLESLEANRREEVWRVARPPSPVIRFLPMGTPVETGDRSSLLAMPPFDHLRPEGLPLSPATRLERGAAASNTLPPAGGLNAAAPRLVPSADKRSPSEETVPPPRPGSRSPLDLLFR